MKNLSNIKLHLFVYYTHKIDFKALKIIQYLLKNLMKITYYNIENVMV